MPSSRAISAADRAPTSSSASGWAPRRVPLQRRAQRRDDGLQRLAADPLRQARALGGLPQRAEQVVDLALRDGQVLLGQRGAVGGVAVELLAHHGRRERLDQVLRDAERHRGLHDRQVAGPGGGDDVDGAARRRAAGAAPRARTCRAGRCRAAPGPRRRPTVRRSASRAGADVTRDAEPGHPPDVQRERLGGGGLVLHDQDANALVLRRHRHRPCLAGGGTQRRGVTGCHVTERTRRRVSSATLLPSRPARAPDQSGLASTRGYSGRHIASCTCWIGFPSSDLGQAFGHRGLGDGDRDRGRHRAQVGDRRQQRCARPTGVGEPGDGVGRGGDHAVADPRRAGHRDAEPETREDEGVVGLGDPVGDPVELDRRERAAGGDQRRAVRSRRARPRASPRPSRWGWTAA